MQSMYLEKNRDRSIKVRKQVPPTWWRGGTHRGGRRPEWAPEVCDSCSGKGRVGGAVCESCGGFGEK